MEGHDGIKVAKCFVALLEDRKRVLSFLSEVLKGWIRECRWLESVHSRDSGGPNDWRSFWEKRKNEKLALLKQHIPAEEYAVFLEELVAP